MNNSKIEWCHDTANLWWGCQEVHAGCDHCYARVLDNRWNGRHWGPHAPRRIVRSVWKDLAKMQKVAAAAGMMRRVFVGSMMDIAEKPMPLVDAAGNEIAGQDTGYLRDLLFQQISAGLYPNLLLLFLSKRPGNYLKYIPDAWKIKPPSNVVYGTSIVNQRTADDMVDELLQVPGKHFLSCEPLLGPIDLHLEKPDNGEPLGIDWVIAGGESGHHARPCHPDWLRGLRDQCEAADVPFLLKQWGEWVPDGQEPSFIAGRDVRDVRNILPDGSEYTEGYIRAGELACMKRVGKKAAGRLLDGVEHNEFPI